jgi:hypothetical protein
MTLDERIAKIRGGRWIRYARAEEITARLDHLLQLPTNHRMPNLLIVGETNNGKTALVNHFLAQHRPRPASVGTPSCIPIIAVQAPPLPDERRFYQAILAKVFAPFRPSKTAGNLQFEVVQLLSAVGVKMLIVDEIQHVLAGPMLKQRHFLNVIKYLGNELQIGDRKKPGAGGGRRSQPLAATRPLTTKTAQIYQVHVLLHDVEPAVWRRLLVCGDATLADLHAIVQIAFGWRDDGRHHFVIRGKTYGDGNVMPESTTLVTFGFRPKERFEYEYGGRWRHQIRFEEADGLAAPHPVCLAGARVAPTEDRSMRSDCERVEPVSTDWLCLYEGLIRLAEARPDEVVRDVVGDMEAFGMAVARVRAYGRRDSRRFDRAAINRRLRTFA